MADLEMPKRRGRPATYASAAERASAWRQRQKELIAQAQQPAEPVVIEKVVEKVIEVPVPERVGGGKTKAQASRLFAVLQDNFGAYGGEESAKRLGANAAKAAGTAREILRMLDHKANIPNTEQSFLRDIVEFFESMNGLLRTAQGKAKLANAHAEVESKVRREIEIAEAVRLTFGETIDPPIVRAMAEALLAYSDPEAINAETKRLGVDRVCFFISRKYELKAALKRNDLPKVVQLVAEIRLAVGEQGRLSNHRGKTDYDVGWADFVRFRANENR